MLWDILYEVGGQNLVDMVSNLLYPIYEAICNLGDVAAPIVAMFEALIS